MNINIIRIVKIKSSRNQIRIVYVTWSGMRAVSLVVVGNIKGFVIYRIDFFFLLCLPPCVGNPLFLACLRITWCSRLLIFLVGRQSSKPFLSFFSLCFCFLHLLFNNKTCFHIKYRNVLLINYSHPQIVSLNTYYFEVITWYISIQQMYLLWTIINPQALFHGRIDIAAWRKK